MINIDLDFQGVCMEYLQLFTSIGVVERGAQCRPLTTIVLPKDFTPQQVNYVKIK